MDAQEPRLCPTGQVHQQGLPNSPAIKLSVEKISKVFSTRDADGGKSHLLTVLGGSASTSWRARSSRLSARAAVEDHSAAGSSGPDEAGFPGPSPSMVKGTSRGATAASCSSRRACCPGARRAPMSSSALNCRGCRERTARARALLDLVGLRRRRPVSASAFGRHAAAHRPCPGPGDRSGHPADGRTVQRPRRPDP